MTNSISSTEIKRLLVSHGLFEFARRAMHIFMALYIWSLTSSLQQVAWFYLVYMLVHCLSFHSAGVFVKRGQANVVKNIGLFLHSIYFFSLYFFGEQAIDHLTLAAIGWGIPNALYWVSYHVQNFDVTHTKNRGHYFGIERGLKKVVDLVTPALGGYLIVAPFGYGYGNLFLLGSVVLLAAMFVGAVKIPHKPAGPFEFRQTWRLLWRDSDIKKSFGSFAAGGIGYSGALSQLIPIFLLIILANEFHVGGWISFFSLVSIIAVVVVGKFVHYKNYKTISLAAGSLLSFSMISLITLPGLLTYIFFGAIKEMLSPFLTLTRKVYSVNLLHRFADYDNHRVEYTIIREWFHIGGRFLSFIPLLFIDQNNEVQLALAIAAMALATLAEPLFLRRIKSDITAL